MLLRGHTICAERGEGGVFKVYSQVNKTVAVGLSIKKGLDFFFNFQNLKKILKDFRKFLQF